jgi:hypothetical protein
MNEQQEHPPELPKSARFRKLGKHYGYPDCCITWFEDRAYRKVGFELTEHQQNIADMGTGFIPCPKCATKVHDENLSINSLITDRQHFYPFPLSDFSMSEKILDPED